jgi:hypothetical protein
VERCGLLDDSLRYCMDYEYWLRLAGAGARFAYIQEKLAGSRLYAENKTLSARVQVHREINEMLKKMFGLVPDRWSFNYAHVVMESRIDRAHHPRWFKCGLILFSLWTTFSWNGRMSDGYRDTLRNWIRV